MMRGLIHNRARAKQLRDFSGLRFGNITATDIDGLIEYHNKGYIIFELKWGDTPLEFGQQLALERLTDTLTRAGKTALCIVASHNGNSDEDIDVANSLVTTFRVDGKWRILTRNELTVKELVGRFIKGRLEKSNGIR